MGEVEFQQRWDFRRNEDTDVDSSCNGSKSSHGALLTKRKLVSDLNSFEDDDVDNETIERLKQKGNKNPGAGAPSNIGKAKRRKTRNIKSSNLKNDKMKKGSPEDVDLRKGDTSTNSATPLDDLKRLMDSLLKDLKVTKGNLLKWMLVEMQKLVEDDASATPEPERRKRSRRGEKVQSQQMMKSRKDGDQHQENHKECMPFHHPNNAEKSVQVQHHPNFQEPVLQQLNSFQETMKQQMQLQEEININRQHQNEFKNGMTSHNCNNASLLRFTEDVMAAGAAATGYFSALGGRIDSGQGTELINLSKKNKGGNLSLSVNPNNQTSSDQCVQVQNPKTVVLAIEAQKGKGGSLKRSAKGKKTIDHSNHNKVHDDQSDHFHGNAMRTAVAGSAQGEKLGSSAVQNFVFNTSGSGEVSSSMYLTLPTVPTEPIVANHGLDASICNYFLPRVAEMKRAVNSERMNQILEPHFNQGSFSFVPPEERIRSFALMESRKMGCINQNSTSSSGFGNGLPVPFHQGKDVALSIPRQVHPQYLAQENSQAPGLRMTGGATKFSGGSYNLSEHIAATNHHSHPAYKSDHGRLMSYQVQNIKDGHLFLQ